MSAAGDRARARIRRNRRELEFMLLSGCFGPVHEAPIDELADLRDAGALAEGSVVIDEPLFSDDVDWYDDGKVINPPADASWVSVRNRPIPITRSTDSRQDAVDGLP